MKCRSWLFAGTTVVQGFLVRFPQSHSRVALSKRFNKELSEVENDVSTTEIEGTNAVVRAPISTKTQPPLTHLYLEALERIHRSISSFA